MKKLSTEQKAERYDEVVSKLKSFMAQGVDPLITRADVQDFFPELKESEGERIRRALIEHIKGIYKGCCTEEVSKERDMFLAWLEEQGNLVKHYEDKLDRCACENFNKGYKRALEIQGKQEPTDKIGSKFHEGDWVANGDYPWKIIVVKPLEYVLQSQDGNIVTHAISHIDEQFHSFTIQDAKDGDVLFQDLMGGKTFIYNGVNSDKAILYSFIISNDGEDVLPYHIGKPNTGIGNIEENKNIIYPATKEQRNLLFQKMKEAGYEWDAERKELKEIEQKPTDEEMKELLRTEYEKGRADAIAEMQVVWSEEDENIKHSIIDILTRQGFQTQVNWLKDRIQPQPQQEWSEEDEKMVKDIIASIDTLYYHGMVNWLKSLKGRIQPQPKREWNKEEHQIIEDAASFILSCVNTAETKEEEERLEELADKLQDLRPQSK